MADRPGPAPGPLDSLLEELRSAATDSAQPSRFEAALARAFERLGFAVQQLGASGETDVLVEAPIGDESYSVVCDAKARGSGKVDQLEVLSLKDHQADNRADHRHGDGYILVMTRETLALRLERLAEEVVHQEMDEPAV